MKLQRGWTRDEVETMAGRGTTVLKSMAKTLYGRASSSTCEPGNDSPICEKPTDATSTQTLPIALGVVIPITCAVIVMVLLHRRNKKKQAIEDLNDPHKSLDFGLDSNMAPPKAAKRKRGKQGPPEMIVTDLDGNSSKRGTHAYGLSMDELGSPYFLPPDLNDSRASLHSMTRSIRDSHDPYRPVPFSRTSSDTSRSIRPFRENGSMYSGSTMNNNYSDKSYLVGHAQRVSQSYPERGPSPLRRTGTDSSKGTSPPRAPLSTNSRSEVPSRKTSLTSSEPNFPERFESKAILPTISSPEVLEDEPPTYALPTELSTKALPPPPSMEPSFTVTPPPRTDSAGGGLQISMSDVPYSNANASYYVEEQASPPMPKFEEQTTRALPKFIEAPEEMEYDIDPSMIYTGRFSIDNSAPSQQHPTQSNRLSYMGLRPLPPDHPEENPEQRANRIRSFYKEYFDVNKQKPANAYYEDYDAGYSDYQQYYQHYEDGWHDPGGADYYYQAPPAPWAQPMGRRAMTPPPRGAPRFEGGHERNYSTMSGGRGPFRGRPPPRKNLPPPKTLTSLPTPHLLKEDSALFNASDFAPPTSFRDTQNGRGADSPLGTQRPFSPSVRAFSPLVSSYQGLAPIPSPHELRKSGTFTSLDFTPQPPRFRGREGAGSRAGSDAGSIRSARSGISAMQMDAVRAGAYRVSRIPKEYVTSKDDIAHQLRPKWNLSTPA